MLKSGSIHEKYRVPGTEIRKGDELGIFQFGGSSIVVAFQKGRIHFDDDLRECSENRIQVAVEVGMSLGEARQGKADGDDGRATQRKDAGGDGEAPSYAEVVKEG